MVLHTPHKGFIHPKNWNSLLENSAENSNFLQKYCLRTQKLSILQCVKIRSTGIFEDQSELKSLAKQVLGFSYYMPLENRDTITDCICLVHFDKRLLKDVCPFFWNKRYGISMIYALLTQNFVVRIHALFPQIFLDWKAKSADIFTSWMYVLLSIINTCI